MVRAEYWWIHNIFKTIILNLLKLEEENFLRSNNKTCAQVAFKMYENIDF